MITMADINIAKGNVHPILTRYQVKRMLEMNTKDGVLDELAFIDDLFGAIDMQALNPMLYSDNITIKAGVGIALEDIDAHTIGKVQLNSASNPR